MSRLAILLLLLSVVTLAQKRDYPDRLPADPTYDERIQVFELNDVHRVNYLISVHQRRTEPEPRWPSRHIGLWKLKGGQWQFLKRLDHDGQAEMVQPFRFQGEAYLWDYAEARHGTTTDDEIFRIDSDDRIIQLKFDLGKTDKLLRAGEHIGWGSLHLKDEDLSMNCLICTGQGGCYPGDSTTDNDWVHAILTIEGDAVREASVERVAGTVKKCCQFSPGKIE